MTSSIMTLSIMGFFATLSITDIQRNELSIECRYDECQDYFCVMLNAIMLGVVMLNVFMLSVVAPYY
jgi:hypothetical protein